MAINTQFIETKVTWNGLPSEVPAPPSGVINESYPYCLITKAIRNDGSIEYFAYAVQGKFKATTAEFEDESVALVHYEEDDGAIVFNMYQCKNGTWALIGNGVEQDDIQIRVSNKVDSNGNLFEVVWSNHDVIVVNATGVETGEIYFAKSGDVTTESQTRSFTLPDLPEGVFDTYKYGFIFGVVVEGTLTSAILTATDIEVIYAPKEIFELPYDMLCGLSGNGLVYAWEAGATEWTFDKESSELEIMCPVGNMDGAEYGLLWANHDIYKVNESLELTGIYFARNDISYEEAYFMPFDWFASMANHARRFSGTSGKLTPDNIDSTLAELKDLANVPFGGVDVDGVFLPDLPKGVLEAYPYAVIMRVTKENAVDYRLVLTKDATLFDPDTSNFVCLTAGYNVYYLDDGTTEWRHVHEGTNIYLSTLDNDVIVWANHDVKEWDSTTSARLDEVYLKSSVGTAYGIIKPQIVEGIANSIRSKTGNTAKLTPEQMASEIDSIVTADGMPNAETGAAFGTDESNGNQYGISSFTNGSIFNSNGNSYGGYKFTVNKPICLVGFSFLAQGSADIMKMRLWDDENKVEVISLNVKASSTGSMQDGLLESPIVLKVGKSYIVTMTGKDDSAYRYWNFETRTSSEKITIVAPVYGFPPNYPTVSSDSTGKINGVDIIFTDVPDEVEITEYKIQTETLTIMADEIKRIKGLTGVLTVEGMISALEGM